MSLNFSIDLLLGLAVSLFDILWRRAVAQKTKDVLCINTDSQKILTVLFPQD